MQMKVILRMRMLRNFLIVTCGEDQDQQRRDLCIIMGEMGQWETISHEFVEKTRAMERERTGHEQLDWRLVTLL